MTRKILGFCAAALILAGCGGGTSRQTPVQVFPDMRKQGKYKPQMERPFFSDHRVDRMPVEGTVAVGHLKEDDAYFTGIVNKQYIGKNPEKITPELLELGQRRFNTYCSPCHDRTGQGRGVVGQRAIWIASNLTEDRIKQYNDGEIFDVITHGRRSMPQYRFQITEHDRWAIIAYVRALQRATMATPDEVPADVRSSLK
jgi:cytochrome c5